MSYLLGTKLLSLAILLFGSSIQRSEAEKICSIQLLNADSLDIDGKVENSKFHWLWVCKDSNQTVSAIETARHELNDEEPMKRSNRSSVRLRRGRSFTPNGCSTPGNLPFFFKKTFTPACNSHDYCYYYKQYSRLGCDIEFYQNMKSICKRRARTLIGKLTLKSCKDFALIYFLAVRVGGKPGYG